MSRRPITRRLAGIACAVAVAGCTVLQPRPDFSRFWVLEPTDAARTAPRTGRGPVVALGPVALPPYLQRSTLVVRLGPTEVRPLESERWAARFPALVVRTLADDVAARLDASRVLTFPWWSGAQAGVVLEVDVTHFEPQPDGAVRLAGRLRAKPAVDAPAARTADFDFLEPAAAGDPAAAVAAMSRALGRLGAALADAARAVRPARRSG